MGRVNHGRDHVDNLGDIFPTLADEPIGNVGGDDKLGDYEARVLRRKDIKLGRTSPKDKSSPFNQWDKASVTRTGKVRAYPRLSDNVWRLVLRSLRQAFPEEKKE